MVCVVIVTYNGERWIEACLNSLRQTIGPYHVLVIDNGSTDKTVAIVKGSFPEVEVIENSRNAGFGQANNIGIKRALNMNCSLLFLLNQDTTVENNALGRLVDAFVEAGNDFGVISPLHMNDSGNDLDVGFRGYVSRDLSDEELNNFLKAQVSAVKEVSFVNAAAWLVPAAIFRDIGGFAPLFFHYGEDRDFVNRIRFHGKKIGLTGNSRIRHHRENRDMDVFLWPFPKLVRYHTTGWVSRAADINFFFPLALLSGFFWVFRESVYAVFRGNARAAGSFFVVLMEVVRKLPSIMRHRNTAKHPQPNSFLL